MCRSDFNDTTRRHGGTGARARGARAGGCSGLRCHRAAVPLILAFVPGCFSPPRRASEMMGNASTAAVSCEVPAHVHQTGLPADCWKCSGELDPRVALSKGRRVVVTEFDVEFVDFQFQLPTPRQLILRPPPISLNPVHLVMRLIGVGRRSSWLAQEQQQALAGDLYQSLVQDLGGRGLVVVSPDELHSSPGYGELPKQSVTRSSPLMMLNPLGTDTGTVLHTRTVAAPGLSVLQGSRQARAMAEARILAETRADVALAVRLRVGTFREQPALEQHSLIRLTGREGTTALRARHSLVSDQAVIEAPRFRPIVGRIEPVAPGRFSSELTAMLPRFIDLALSEPKP